MKNSHALCSSLAQNSKPDTCLCPLCCRSLLRFLSHAAQVTGHFLIYTGKHMLQVLGDTEEQTSPRLRSRQKFRVG